MYVINIALRRPDGKVENDTVFGEKQLTKSDAEEIALKFECDVIVSTIGTIAFFNEDEIRETTFHVENPKKEGVENGSKEG